MIDQRGVCTVVEQVDSFADLRTVSDAFVAGMAIFVEVAPDGALLRRVVDFLSGLASGTEAHLERVDQLTYLIIPDLDWLDVHDGAFLDATPDPQTEPAVFDSSTQLLDVFAAAV